MSQSYQQILLVVDAAAPSAHVLESAKQLAKKHNAKVTVVDTIREPSTFSRWLSPNSDDVFNTVVSDKKEKLAKVAEDLHAAGITSDSEVLIGKSSEAITRSAISRGADLVVRYMKGHRSRMSGVFGNTARNLMRVCPVPVFFVGEKTKGFGRIMACVDVDHGSNENQAIMREAEKFASGSGEMLGVYCWDLYGKQLVKNHMSEDSLKEMIKESERMHQEIFDQMLANTELGQFEGKMRMVNGEPASAIPRICGEESIEVVVMCSASLNHPIQRFLGSTVEAILYNLPCSLLVVKPEGFVSPVKVEN